MKRVRCHRPNVTPAKVYGIKTNLEVINENESRGISQSYRRKTISDVCDFCFKYARFRRSFISLRLRGYRTACQECIRKLKLDYKKDKVLGEQITNLPKNYEETRS